VAGIGSVGVELGQDEVGRAVTFVKFSIFERDIGESHGLATARREHRDRARCRDPSDVGFVLDQGHIRGRVACAAFQYVWFLSIELAMEGQCSVVDVADRVGRRHAGTERDGCRRAVGCGDIVGTDR
jgi:hypothetical protein